MVIGIEKIKYFYNSHKRKCHIISIIDDKEERLIVYKYFGKYKQWWHYEVATTCEIESRLKIGLYKINLRRV